MATPEAGIVHVRGPFDVPGLVARHVRVYLPRGYGTRGPHPLALYFDGQNVFGDDTAFAGGWHLHTAAEKIATRRRVPPVIVGIDHGGPTRLDELSPFGSAHGPGSLDPLLDWLTGFVVPSLRRDLSLVAGPAGIVVGGSSMGGLAAMYAHVTRPDTFGAAVCHSPSFWFARRAIFDAVRARGVPWTSRVWIDGGELERGVVRLAHEMKDTLLDHGYVRERLSFVRDARGRHDEASWRRRAPRALRFVLAA